VPGAVVCKAMNEPRRAFYSITHQEDTWANVGTDMLDSGVCVIVKE